VPVAECHCEVPVGACNLRPLFFIFSYFLLPWTHYPACPAPPLPCPAPPLPCPCPALALPCFEFSFCCQGQEEEVTQGTGSAFFQALPTQTDRHVARTEGHCEVPRGCLWPSATLKFYKFYFFLSFTLYLAPALPALSCPLPYRAPCRALDGRFHTIRGGYLVFFQNPFENHMNINLDIHRHRQTDRSLTDWPASVGRNYTEAVCPGRFSRTKSVCSSIRPTVRASSAGELKRGTVVFRTPFFRIRLSGPNPVFRIPKSNCPGRFCRRIKTRNCRVRAESRFPNPTVRAGFRRRIKTRNRRVTHRQTD